MKLVSPYNEVIFAPHALAARLDTLTGRTIALLDISKPGGNHFLDRLETLLQHRGALTKRVMKPAFSKPAPPDLLESLKGVDALVEALAD